LLTSPIHHSANPAPFATIVFAGHVNSGGGAYCDCGCSGCRCDPGESEIDCPHTNRATPANANGATDHANSPIGKTGTSGLDVGSSALMLALALWLWARLRA
jgi:hypothetical protein